MKVSTVAELMKTAKVEDWKVFAGDGSGKPVRIATKVIITDGIVIREMRFLDKLTKKEALCNAEHQLLMICDDGKINLTESHS